MKIKELETVSIIGLGLLGGSIGMALNRTFSSVRRVGYSHRKSTCRKALKAGTVDEICQSVSKAVGQSQLVILASPIGTFAGLMEEMAQSLQAGCIVTDVGSTKVEPVRWAGKYLPARVEFLGSHPMAGSEQRGVEFARADLFDNAHCILTPTARSSKVTITFLSAFWRGMGMRLSKMSPAQHDQVMGRISHLPHVLATALVNCLDAKEILLCGKGFLDTTRIASGPAGLWRDILMNNPVHTDRAITRLIRELERMQKTLRSGNEEVMYSQLNRARIKRDQLVAKKLRRKELPA